MEYHLDREIRLVQETEYPALYSWSLQEFPQDEKDKSAKLIPWGWTLHFEATELKYIKHIGSSIHKENSTNKNSEFIQVNIRPEGSKLLDIQHPPRFSFLGTDRQIKDFSLTIHCLPSDQDVEKCNAWGIVSYTFEIDFRNSTSDDQLGFEVWLTPKDFNDICSLAKYKKPNDSLRFSCSGAGFYSEWSPTISTSRIKVLAHGKEQKITIPEGYNEPLRLGDIPEFSLYFNRKNLFSLEHADELDELTDNINYDLENEMNNIEKPDFNAGSLAQSNILQKMITKLLIPLWIIAISLIIMLLR